jgi:uncharacterized BrkB/YihY/UPF0761 family membrane protein
VSIKDDRSNELLPPDRSAQLDRLAKWRVRAEHAANRYQDRAVRQPVLGLPLVFVARYTGRQGVLLASAAAFRLFLWLLPLGLLAAGILAGVSPGHEAGLESASKVAGVTGAASQHVVTALHDGHRSWWAAILLGAVLFLWATRKLVRNLTIVNAHLWGVPVPKRRQRDALITAVIIAGGWIVTVTATAFLWRLHDIHFVGAVISVVTQSLILTAAWLVISRRLPARASTVLDLAPGCIVFGLGLAVLNAVSRTYLTGSFEHSSALYGSLGIAAVILGWLLIIWHLIVSSAVINSVWSEYRAPSQAGLGGQPPGLHRAD